MGSCEQCGRMVMGLRRLWRCFAKECTRRRGCRAIFGGSYSPNPCTHPGIDPAPGDGLCLLSIAGCLSVLFVPSCLDGVCFWGRSASTAAKLLGCYCGRALL